MIKKLLSLLKKQPPPKERHMQLFSREYLDALIAEHRLVSASIAHIQAPANYNRFVRTNSYDSVALAISTLTAKRVELEAKIDVLNDYLD